MPQKDLAKKREYDRQWRARNRESIREKNRLYRQANPEIIRAASRRRRGKRVQQSDPHYNWVYRLKMTHGMSPADWQAMRDAQGGCCYLCREPLSDVTKEIAIDHDHSCCPSGSSCAGCRRGLACHGCNMLIGIARDDPGRLIMIAENLRKALGERGAAAGGTTRSLLVNPLSRVATGYLLSPASRPREDLTLF